MAWRCVVCMAAVLAAVLTRVIVGWRANVALRGTALGSVGVFSLFIALWLPNGPLGSEWARRSGTPTALLPHHHVPAKPKGSGE